MLAMKAFKTIYFNRVKNFTDGFVLQEYFAI